MKKVTLYFVLASMILLMPLGFVHAQWNTNTLVNIQISSLSSADLQSAATSDGKTWVAFYHENAGVYEMWAQLFDPNGYKLLGNDGVLVSNQPTGSATFVFSVCVDAEDNFVIACQDERTGPDVAVVYKISQSGTHLWSPTGIVLGEGLAPYPALLTTGEIAVAWNETQSSTLKIHKITNNGTLAWATPVTVLVGSSLTTRGQLVGNPEGKFTMVYQKRGYGIATTLYAQKFNNDGLALYAPVQICNETSAPYRYYSIDVEDDTTYFGYYTSTSNRFNSYLQRINPDGTIPWGMNGSHFNIATGSANDLQMTTNINLTPGSPYVWSVCTFSDPNQDNYGIYIQKFLKTTGARQFTDYAKVVYTIGGSNYREEGALALVDDTPMFMFYGSDGKIYATRLDSAGNFAWPNNQVELSSTTNNSKMRYNFTPDGPNRCAGFWTEDRGTGLIGYAQGISIGGLIGILVETQGGAPAQVNTPAGTLQMASTVYPSSANQLVDWSIAPVTGQATINASGLLTAVGDGTVWAIGAAAQDATVSDSVLVTITNQATGTGEITGPTNDLLVYPVPNNGLFTVEPAGQGSGDWQVTVCNVVGTKVFDTGKLPANSNKRTVIDIRSLPEGVYFVNYLSEGSSFVRKIVVRD